MGLENAHYLPCTAAEVEYCAKRAIRITADQTLADNYFVQAWTKHAPCDDVNLIVHFERDRQNSSEHDIVAAAGGLRQRRFYRQFRRGERIAAAHGELARGREQGRARP